MDTARSTKCALELIAVELDLGTRHRIRLNGQCKYGIATADWRRRAIASESKTKIARVIAGERDRAECRGEKTLSKYKFDPEST